VQNYSVNGAAPTAQVCWNGSTEVILSGAATCQAMAPSANPVYMITSLAVSSLGTARRMVQAEVALASALSLRTIRHRNHLPRPLLQRRRQQQPRNRQL
jgi:hypothetical protein